MDNQTILIENENVKSQVLTLKSKRGEHSKYLPYVFIEQGVSMLSAVLRSKIFIARAFKWAGIIEQHGSGIKRIKDECKLHGVKEPKFEEFVHGFRVIVYKEKLQKNSGGVNEVYVFIKKQSKAKIRAIE